MMTPSMVTQEVRRHQIQESVRRAEAFQLRRAARATSTETPSERRRWSWATFTAWSRAGRRVDRIPA